MSELARSLGISEERLLDFVREQRWFGGRGRDATGLELLDAAPLDGAGEGTALVELIAEVRYTQDGHDFFHLVAETSEGAGDGGAGDGDRFGAEGRSARDALAGPAFARELLEQVRAGGGAAAAEGSISFCHADGADLAAEDVVRSLGVEQSNSSFVVGERLFVKAYRRLEAGVNPELEMLRFLCAHDFGHVPRLEAWWAYSGPSLGATLGIVQGFVPGAVDGWSLALDELVRDPDGFLGRVSRLGEVIGGLHATLASDAHDPEFAPEEPGPEAVALLAATVDDEVDQVFLRLPGDDALGPIAGAGEAVRSLVQSLATVSSTGRVIRQHGDLHLGQVLWTESGDWLVVDFEGEPTRVLTERRRKRSPLRDAAGMLRSFSYAVFAAGLSGEGLEERCEEAFLGSYLEALAPSGILPANTDSVDRLIGIFQLEKAVYELRYELAHRPGWVGIPAAGIARLLERSSL